MKKVSIKQKAHQVKRAQAGTQRKASRKLVQAKLRLLAKSWYKRPHKHTPPAFAPDPGVADLPDTDTVKL